MSFAKSVTNDICFNQEDFSMEGKIDQRTYNPVYLNRYHPKLSAYREFLKDLINENAKYKNGSFELDIKDVSLDDKKIFLSYLDIDEYEAYCRRPSLLAHAIADHEEKMQAEINYVIDDVFHENMEEMGYVLKVVDRNRDYYWSKE